MIDVSGKVYDPVGYCIYCNVTESPDGLPLSDEHIVPEGMGGTLVLPSASCSVCRDITSAFERNFQRDMYGPTRAFWRLYGKRRKKERPESFPVEVDHRMRTVDAALDEYPYILVMPLLDPPGLLFDRPINPYEFPDLRQPGRLWRWKLNDADSRAQQLLNKHAAENIYPSQRIYLTDFFKMIAKIAHGFAIAQKGYNPAVRYLLPGLIRAPKGAVTNGATYLVGTAHNQNGTRVVVAPTTAACNLSVMIATPPDLLHQIVTVRVQLFAWLGTPVYEAVVYRFPPIIGQKLARNP